MSKKSDKKSSPTLENCAQTYDSVVAYLQDEYIFQSTPRIKKCENNLKACKTFDDVFQTPIEMGQLDFSGALHWMNYLFILSQTELVIEEKFSSSQEFSLSGALKYIHKVLDVEHKGLKDMAEGIESRSCSSDSSSDDDEPHAAN